jgi:hypothetical protein
MASRARGTITLTNAQPTEIVLTLEPWADEHVVGAGKTILVQFDGPNDASLEIVTQPGKILIHGWEGSVLDVR